MVMITGTANPAGIRWTSRIIAPSRQATDVIARITTGGVSSWGGAIVRGDIVMTHTDLDTYWSAVANISYSWNWSGKNISGVGMDTNVTGRFWMDNEHDPRAARVKKIAVLDLTPETHGNAIGIVCRAC